MFGKNRRREQITYRATKQTNPEFFVVVSGTPSGQNPSSSLAPPVDKTLLTSSAL